MNNCSICLETSKSPWTTPKCHHTFCNICILEWITQNDKCPLCRKLISHSTKLGIEGGEGEGGTDDDEGDGDEGDGDGDEGDGEDGEDDDRYIINIYGDQVSNEELCDINYRISDYINTIDEPMAIYQWIEANNGSLYTTIRKKKFYIDLKFDIFKINYSQSSAKIFQVNIYVTKRPFIEHKQLKFINKFRGNKHLKFINKFRFTNQRNTKNYLFK
jgi:hypothetical protein